MNLRFDSAYNLGNVLREDPTFLGLLYVVGLFLPIQNLWTAKTYYDARFYYENDYFHRCYEVALLLSLASAVLYIRPVAILSNPAKTDMFAFCLSILVAYVLALGRLIEVMVCQRFGKQDSRGLFPESFVATRRDAIFIGITIVFVLSAVVYGGIMLRANESAYDEQIGTSTTNYTRFLATFDSSSAYSSDHAPIWLLLASTLSSFLVMLARHMQALCVPRFDHKK